ncbi:Alpha/beta hydrolase BEM46 [Paraburkholderia sabiae]|jgi:alpha-beta hydrolase superfamily lysophospholipase|uniref:alpha/beta hydrolase n=1 Tax=Paraburkholderia sabiae TaxID=273251 RepID=UPI001CB57103|nr:alpha/beta fold hydrolase [Paraburkholderia sabiae]CAG9207210.1 Alpha/beta hydrolase BEM46 [Paraburkholderia sabiae]
MSLITFCIRLALAAYVVALVALYFMQDRMLLPASPDVAGSLVGHHAAYDVERWQADGEYAGYLVTPAAAPRGTFLVFHGNAETAENKLPVAGIFVRDGYRVVVVEYPGQGNREGKRTMLAALAASREALVAARAQWPGPLYLVGESLGAGMAAQAIAGNEKSVAGVALITPWDSLASVASTKYPIFPVRWMLHDPFDSVAALARYDGPLVVIGAQQDTLIPIVHAQRLAGTHPGAHLMLLPDANHEDWFGAMNDAHWQQVLRWMQAD